MKRETYSDSAMLSSTKRKENNNEINLANYSLHLYYTQQYLIKLADMINNLQILLTICNFA